MRYVVLTGLSGAGKTQALHALEDMGFYCVDNLPPLMLRAMAEMCQKAQKTIDRVAVVVDIRGGAFFEGIEQALEDMRELGIDYEILFLDASDEELVRRYKETRRAHPMGNEERIIRSIQREREALAPLRNSATRVIDTSSMLNRQLREAMVRLYGKRQSDTLQVNVLSFGFKNGMPQDADLVIDVRFLPNPFYVQGMRELTGLDEPVQHYIDAHPETAEFMQKTIDWLSFLMPLYVREGKSRLVIGIGCTGGQHRSVYLAECIGARLRELQYVVSVSHRDM